MISLDEAREDTPTPSVHAKKDNAISIQSFPVLTAANAYEALAHQGALTKSCF